MISSEPTRVEAIRLSTILLYLVAGIVGLVGFLACHDLEDSPTGDDSTDSPGRRTAAVSRVETTSPGPTEDPSHPGAFVLVEPGTFTMGSPPEESGRDDDERRHEVTLTHPFWIGVTEVTQGQWRRVTGLEPSFFPACGDDCPVERVSWYDAVRFANLLSEREGLETCYELGGCTGTFGGGCPEGEDWCSGGFRCREVELVGLDCSGYRLPTEGEWEYAARAGTKGPTWAGSFTIEDLNSAPALDSLAWYGGNSRVEYRPAWDCSDWSGKQREARWCGTHPVDQKQANPWGLQDVLGNVWEWTWDWKGPYPEEPAVDPTGPGNGKYKVRRGCSWANIPDHCRTADRSDDAPEVRDRNWGLRLVRTACSAGPEVC